MRGPRAHTIKRETLFIQLMTSDPVDLGRPERARNAGSTGPKRLEDTPSSPGQYTPNHVAKALNSNPQTLLPNPCTATPKSCGWGGWAHIVKRRRWGPLESMRQRPPRPQLHLAPRARGAGCELLMRRSVIHPAEGAAREGGMLSSRTENFDSADRGGGRVARGGGRLLQHALPAHHARRLEGVIGFRNVG